MRLISAHCSTPTTRLLLARADARARLQTQPDTPDPAPGGSLFNRRRWVSIQAAPTGVSARSDDVVPASVAGRATAAVVMLAGLELLAGPTPAVTNAFVEAAARHRGARGDDAVPAEIAPPRRQLAELRSELLARS